MPCRLSCHFFCSVIRWYHLPFITLVHLFCYLMFVCFDGVFIIILTTQLKVFSELQPLSLNPKWFYGHCRHYHHHPVNSYQSSKEFIITYYTVLLTAFGTLHVGHVSELGGLSSKHYLKKIYTWIFCLKTPTENYLKRRKPK